MVMRQLLYLAAVVAGSAGEVTISLANLESFSLDATNAVTSSDDLFRRSCPEEFSPELPYTPEILISSSTGFSDPQDGHGMVFPSSGSFIRGAIEAWAQHQHLTLRPDEIWFEVLVQLNFYMTAHAEELRHLFVSHEGKEKILVPGFSWRDVVAEFGSAIQERVKTEWLLEWILPGFSTSTPEDDITATVLMMGLTQKYFDFEGMIICGIPSVTLLGSRADWVRLLSKLDRLKDWGAEPAAYAGNLRPIFERFVRSWDEPESDEVRMFWRQIVRAHRTVSCGGGASGWMVDGWITGFVHWKKEGGLRVREDVWFDDDEEEYEVQEVIPDPRSLTLDDITYVPESLDEIPVSYAKAPLKLAEYPAPGETTEAYLLAGNVGIRKTVGDGGDVMATPLSGWCLYAPVRWNLTMGMWTGDGMELEGVAEGFEMCLGGS